MKQLLNIFGALAVAAGLAGCIAAPIELTPQTEQRLLQQAPIRFLLTFDDGPSASSFWNPTMTVLDSLANNQVVVTQGSYQAGQLLLHLFFARGEVECQQQASQRQRQPQGRYQQCPGLVDRDGHRGPLA